jgi:outer membrane protein assembly factor BamB
LGFVVFCNENIVVADGDPGIHALDLSTGRALWSALPNSLADVSPAAAGDAVAVIADSWMSLYAFSKVSGKLLWRKQRRSNILASDGRYFYVPRPSADGISALDPRTGAVVWTLRIPKKGGAAFFEIRDGVLYSNSFAIDLRSRKLLHQWPEDIVVTAIAFPRPGETLLGDSDGNLTLYDSSFAVTKRLHAGDTTVGSIAANEYGILVSLPADSEGQRGIIEFLTWDGKQKWRIPGFPIGYVYFHPFVIAGHDALIVELDDSGKNWRFESRSLATGTVNWVVPNGIFYDGWPVVCGDRVLLRDGDDIKSFGILDGKPSAPRPSRSNEPTPDPAGSIAHVGESEAGHRGEPVPLQPATPGMPQTPAAQSQPRGTPEQELALAAIAYSEVTNANQAAYVAMVSVILNRAASGDSQWVIRGQVVSLENVMHAIDADGCYQFHGFASENYYRLISASMSD